MTEKEPGLEIEEQVRTEAEPTAEEKLAEATPPDSYIRLERSGLPSQIESEALAVKEKELTEASEVFIARSKEYLTARGKFLGALQAVADEIVWTKVEERDLWFAMKSAAIFYNAGLKSHALDTVEEGLMIEGMLDDPWPDYREVFNWLKSEIEDKQS